MAARPDPRDHLDEAQRIAHQDDRPLAVITDAKLANATDHQAEYRIVRPDEHGQSRLDH